MAKPEFIDFLTNSLQLMSWHSAKGAVHFVCMDWRHIGELCTAGDEVGLELMNVCAWVKPNAGMGSFYRSQHEFVFVFRTGHGRHRNNIQLGKYGRHRSNVWSYPSPSSFGRVSEEGRLAALHPTVKPVQMVADAILDCSKRGDLVLDPFLGSGTTIIAAERTGRRCFGLEIDPTYVDCAIRRWQTFSGDHAKHLQSGLSFEQLAARQDADNA